MLRTTSAATVGAVIAFCALAVPAPRLGAAASACTATGGVTVIVDFTHFGGEIERGCDPGAPADALDAVHDAGFATAGTARYGDAFVCRIDSLPSPASQACTDTPPAHSSWAFYYARPTDPSWTYSALGVLSYQPAPGTLLAFAFGDVAKPGVLPSGAAVTTTTTTTTRPRTEPRRPAPPPPKPPVTVRTDPPVTVRAAGVTTAPTTVPDASTASTSAPRTTRPTRHRSTTTTTVPPTPRIVDKTATGPAPTGGSGSPVPAVLTLGLVAVLGAGAFAAAATRRRHRE